MNLTDLKRYLQQHTLLSLANLVDYFQVDPELLRHMLQRWERKGCIRKSLKTSACQTKCAQCSPLVVEMYEWVSDAQ